MADIVDDRLDTDTAGPHQVAVTQSNPCVTIVNVGLGGIILARAFDGPQFDFGLKYRF